MGKGKTPPPPDYSSMAREQSASGVGLNRPNQYSPWGSETWSQAQATDPTTGKPFTQWSQHTTLDPTLQRGLNAQMGLDASRSEMAQGMLGRVGDQLGGPLDTSGFTQWGGAPEVTTQGFDFGGERKRAEDALYKSATSRLDPQWQQRQTDMDTQLANSGITRNSDAYSRAQADFGRNRNDAYEQARTGAITGGGLEAQRSSQQQLAGEQQQYAQQLGAGGFMDEQRQRMLAEAAAMRGLPLNEMNSLLQGSQVRMPTFGDYTPVAPADLMGAAKGSYEGQVAGANAQQASQGQAIGAAATVAAAFI